MFDKLHLGTSYSAVGQKFNVHESTTYIKVIFEQKHKVIYGLVDKNVTRGLQEFNPVFSVGTRVYYSLIEYLW